jgi:hypothetical protein
MVKERRMERPEPSQEGDKLAAMETEEFFADRRKRADHEAFLRILNRKGGEEPRPEDRIEG